MWYLNRIKMRNREERESEIEIYRSESAVGVWQYC